MPKFSRLNKEYTSPLEDWFGWGPIYRFLYPEDYWFSLPDYPRDIFHRRHRCHASDIGSWEQRYRQIQQSIHPLERISKYYHDSFRPYKSKRHIAKDIMQTVLHIFKGIGNILRGMLIILFFAAYSIVLLGYFIISPLLAFIDSTGVNYQQSFKKNLIQIAKFATYTIAFIFDAASSILHGALQILSIPTIPLRILNRIYLTHTNGWQKVEEDRGVKQLTNAYHDPFYKCKKNENYIRDVLLRKYIKAELQGREFGEILPDSPFYFDVEAMLPAEIYIFFDKTKFDNLPIMERCSFARELYDRVAKNSDIIKHIERSFAWLDIDPEVGRKEINQYEEKYSRNEKKILELFKKNGVYINRPMQVLLCANRRGSHLNTHGPYCIPKQIAKQISFFTACKPIIPPAALRVVNETPAAPAPASAPATRDGVPPRKSETRRHANKPTLR